MLQTERLLLRLIEKSDAEAIFDYSHSPAVGPNAGWKPHATLKETREVMRRVFLDRPDVFGVVLAESGQLIGSIGLIPDPKRENEETRMLGYAIGERYWGQGYMTEAARAVVAHGFETVGCKLISAYCYPDNARSKNVLRKLGFSYEGRLALSARRFDGVVLDEECYALRREDWNP